MSDHQPQLYFTLEKFSHHFVVKKMSPMGQAAAEAFARKFIQFKWRTFRGRSFKEADRVYAAKVGPENELRFHTGQWPAFIQFLNDRGITPKCYEILEYGFEPPADLGAKLVPGWEARDYQIPIIEYLKDPQPTTRKLVEIQTGRGKSQPGYSKVLTAEGWKRMDQIKVGEVVVTQDGSFTTVEEVYENGLRPMQKITLEDGREAIADKEHLWRVNYYKEKLYSSVINTDHIRVLVETGKKVYLPLRRPDSSMAFIGSVDEGLPGRIATGTTIEGELEKLEFQAYPLKNAVLKALLKIVEIDGENGRFYLKVPENKALQRVFWSCGFICRWDEEKASYDVFCEGLETFFEGELVEQVMLAMTNREFRGVAVAKVENLEVMEDAYCIKVKHPLHLYITDEYIVTHNTFCAAAAASSLGSRIVMFLKPKYLEKWERDLKALLGIEPEEIEMVKGSKSLMHVIAKAAAGDLDCKAIIVSNRTFQNYITLYEKQGKKILDQGYDCLPQEFIQMTGCGVRIIDEVHEDFHLNFKIDLYTHVEWAISLSATLVSDDPFITEMHEIAYAPEIRYNGLDYDKYVDSYAFLYRIANPEKIRTTELGNSSYSHTAFEKSIARNPKLLEDYLDMIAERVELRYLTRMKSGQRCLLYAASIQMCTIITDYLKKLYPDLDVRRYVENDPYDNLMEADLCVSTIGSAGTGHDIPNLITVILTVAIASKASNIQGFGRLRKLNGVDVEFEYFTCLDIPKHVEYHERKELLISGLAKRMFKESKSLAIGM